jgi:hypothetical protein
MDGSGRECKHITREDAFWLIEESCRWAGVREATLNMKGTSREALAYYYAPKSITICGEVNLTAEIVLHEVAHHIDFCRLAQTTDPLDLWRTHNRRKHHCKRFRNICRDLLSYFSESYGLDYNAGAC